MKKKRLINEENETRKLCDIETVFISIGRNVNYKHAFQQPIVMSVCVFNVFNVFSVFSVLVCLMYVCVE
jgi:hypothetical protein